MTNAPRIDGWTVIGTIAAVLFITVQILQPEVNSHNILTAFPLLTWARSACTTAWVRAVRSASG